MKQILLDERISPQAKGFYLLMCEANIGGITLSSEELAKLSGYSKNTVLKFIKELSHSNIVKQLEIIYNYSIKELAIVFEYGMVMMK